MKKYIALIIVVASILSPGFKLISGLPSIRFEDIFILLVILYGALKPNVVLKYLTDKDGITHNFLLIAFFSLFSLANQELIFGTPLIFSDIMIIPMMVKYWVIAQLIKSLDLNERMIKAFLISFLLAGALSALIGIFQYHNAAGVNNWLTPLYINRDIQLQLILKEHISARIVGTNGDPRYFGFILVCVMSIVISMFLHKPFKYRMLLFLVAAVVSLALMYTLSRTPILSLIIVSGFAVYIYSKYSKNAVRGIVYILCGFLVATFFAYKTPFLERGMTAFEGRVLSTNTVSFQMSKRARIRDLMTPLNDALENPAIFIFGRGPSKGYMRTSSHNDYGWIFHRYGLCGLALYFLLILKGIKFGVMKYASAELKTHKTVYMASAMVILNWFLFAGAESILKSPQMMSINAVFLGLLANRTTPAATENESGNNTILKQKGHRYRPQTHDIRGI